jgi:hypothetical protein
MSEFLRSVLSPHVEVILSGFQAKGDQNSSPCELQLMRGDHALDSTAKDVVQGTRGMDAGFCEE